MKLTVTLDMGNSAFSDSPAIEAAAILTHAADEFALRPLPETPRPLHDVNGNTVGHIAVTYGTTDYDMSSVERVDLGQPFTVTTDRTFSDDTEDPDAITMAESDPRDLFGGDLSDTWNGWHNVSSLFTGQQGAPNTLHPSEVVSGSMARRILTMPGRWVFVPLDDTEDPDGDALGWLALTTSNPEL